MGFLFCGLLFRCWFLGHCSLFSHQMLLLLLNANSLLSFLSHHRLLFFFLLFIYFWLCWVFVSVRGLSPVAESGGHSSSRCAGLSPSRPLLLRSTGSRRAGSVVVAHGLQTRRLSSCGSQAQLLRGMWDLPRPGLEPVSPALAGRFSTTAPPGKPPHRRHLAWNPLLI